MTRVNILQIPDIKEVYDREGLVAFGLRGYYATDDRDRIGVYDDCIGCIINPVHRNFGFDIVAVRGNTEPSIAKYGVATLKPGLWRFTPGLHGISGPKPYPAFREVPPFTVTRYGRDGEFTDTPSDPFCINLHRGGYNSTSSLGCQTVHPDNWYQFYNTVKHWLDANQFKGFMYYLANRETWSKYI